MINKPFKPPMLKRPGQTTTTATGSRPADGTISADLTARKVTTGTAGRPVGDGPKRRVVVDLTEEDEGRPGDNGGGERYYRVLWRKYTLKKNKTWDGDGVVVVKSGYMHLYGDDGVGLGKSVAGPAAGLADGSTVSVSGREVQIETMISRAEFGTVVSERPVRDIVTLDDDDEETGMDNRLKRKKHSGDAHDGRDGVREPVRYIANPATVAKLRSQFRPPSVTMLMSTATKTTAPTTSTTLATSTAPAAPTAPAPARRAAKPKHDPNEPGALVMRRPEPSRPDEQIVDVVVDPLISQHLRPHQREGVKFMYECVMGMRPAGDGCILADEMGLGKTVQTIAVLWTLLRQNPIVRAGRPVARKAVVVCPVGLVDNWRREFVKWLGRYRIGVFVPDDRSGRRKLTDFTNGPVYSVMVVGYERLRTIADQLATVDGIDVVVADEGHRLKTVGNKSAAAIRELQTSRRMILSGTPVQNDLGEFFAMADFVNPGVLGKSAEFRRKFEQPIVRGRQPEATSAELAAGRDLMEELGRIAGQFVLRRTAEVIGRFLPAKTEYVMFCRLTGAQTALYRALLATPAVVNTVNRAGPAGGAGEAVLKAMGDLRKACSSPSLLVAENTELSAGLDPGLRRRLAHPHACGKIRVLEQLLELVHDRTDEKVVVVSNWTATLDVLSRVISGRGWHIDRLDGSVPSSKRQAIVDQFNRTARPDAFAFLLSAKAGGVGLNLVGASRLILFDIDWNPAVDLQTMGRIHRDGQTRNCHVYRLLSSGALDEKVYMRQIVKLGLADAVVVGGQSQTSFTADELRDLFSLDESGKCKTHELLGCECGGKGIGGSDDVNGLSIKTKSPYFESTSSTADSDSDSDDSLPDLPSIISASRVNMADQESRLRRRHDRAVKDGMRKHALMKYAHLDVNLLSRPTDDDGDGAGLSSTAIDDDVTDALIRHPHGLVNYVFARRRAGGLADRTSGD